MGMKLREVINSGNIADLVEQYANAFRKQDEESMEEAKGLIAASLLSKGWDRTKLARFMTELQNIGDIKDAYNIMTKWGIFDDDLTEESPIDPVNQFNALISLPMVAKGNVKAEIKQFESFLRKKGIKLIKKGKANLISFTAGPSDDEKEVIDIEIEIIFKTKMERDEIFAVIEPSYELLELSDPL